MICPKCGSDKINVQVISQPRRRGCFKIFLYILLACTIIGIPIMILIAVLRGRKTTNRTIKVCQNCGYHW